MTRMPPPVFDGVAIAASLGGPAAILSVLEGLPAFFPVPIVVAQHRSSEAPDRLPEMFARRCALPVRRAVDGDRLRPGIVCVPPGQLLHVDGCRDIRLVHKERPATEADALFSSMAAAVGGRCLAVVLTGRLTDGAAGVRDVKRAGGRVLVQDPATAAADGMPNAALATGCADFALPLALIAPAIMALALSPGASALLRVPVPSWVDLRRAS